MRQTGLLALGLIATLMGTAALAWGEAPGYQGRPDAVADPDPVQVSPLAADPAPGRRPGLYGGQPPAPGPGKIQPAPSPPEPRPTLPSPAPGKPPGRDDRDYGHRPSPDWRSHAWGPSPWYGPYYPYYRPYYPYYRPYYPYDPYYPYYPAPSPTWVPGHWEWNGWQWVWQPGYWRYY